MPRGQATYGADTGGPGRPELADVGRLARRLVTRTVAAARADEVSVGRLLAEHLGAQTTELPVAKGSWPAYDRVNVQTALDVWLTEPARDHRVVGLTQYRHRDFGLADLLHSTERWGPGIGSIETQSLPAGPNGETRQCVQCAIYLTTDTDGKAALLVRGPEEHGTNEGISVEVVATNAERASEIVAELSRLSVEHNVFRGHVIAFGDEVFGRHGTALLTFVERPHLDREQVVLPPQVLAGIERQVLGVARHAPRLLASGQHLRRGVLLYGPPGTGKTHTVRYLIGRLPGVTVVILSGRALGMIAQACSVARTLQPAVVVVEDVDLIAEERGRHLGNNPLLFELLNEMDGLGSDIDVTFLLTTNRADLLEHALAARPGRVDHAAQLPVPDAAARAQLLHLYRGRLDLDLADPGTVIARTEGVTASFIKELLRRAALVAAEQDADAGDADAGDADADDADAVPAGAATESPIRVTDAHLTAALDQLLDTTSALTQVLLGGGPATVNPVDSDPPAGA
jgi:ATPase family associated with various cellular activities (AAA)